MPRCDFSDAYDEHVWRVYGFFAYRMRNRADAEDLTQQTFERALRAWSRYDPARGGVSTWLLAIAHNLLVDHLRADRKERQQPLDELYDADPFVDREQRYDLGLEPEIEDALAVLTPREREIVALRFGGDLKGPAIAATTGLSVANVQQILSRSLRRMRTAIDASREAASPTTPVAAGAGPRVGSRPRPIGGEPMSASGARARRALTR